MQATPPEAANDSASTTPPTVPDSARTGHIWYRRDVLSIASWTALAALIGGGLLAVGRFLFPRVLFEHDRTFVAGRPENYSVGQVDTRFVAQHGAWVVRDEEGVYALLARCTHLGCTPRWQPTDRKFKCPCHGSGFTIDGTNFEGPAPTPLVRLRVSLNAEGRVVVDKSREFRAERDEWSDPEARIVI